jgi:hypothetical protein
MVTSSPSCALVGAAKKAIKNKKMRRFIDSNLSWREDTENLKNMHLPSWFHLVGMSYLEKPT